jgi:hypothetical protein
MIYVPYSDAVEQKLIQEADVLLFRGVSLSSWLIKRYGGGVHSHAGMAHWDGDHLECVEFREFKGGRAVSLKTQVDSHPDNIDIFRPATRLQYNEFISSEAKYSNTNHRTAFEPNKITDTMINLTGLPYGWKNIWKLAKHYLPFYRLAPQNMKDDDPTNVFVCSTAVAFAYRQAYIDPVPYLADSAVMPADLARSALFKYQFTISKDW